MLVVGHVGTLETLCGMRVDIGLGDPMGLSRPSSYSKVELLLVELCTGLGFCLSAEAQGRLLSDPPIGVNAFADAVIVAEWLDPELIPKSLRLQVRDCVARYLADEV
jgi:hypothetical protein